MKKINSKDVYFARNQPYGYWRVGNPIVKITIVILIAIGVFVKDPSLVLQASAVVFIMLWARFDPKSKFQIVVINFGLGFVIVSLLDPNVSPYNLLRFTTIIPYIAKIDWSFVVMTFVMMGTFLAVRPAVTSRDYAWLINIFPTVWFRENVGGTIYSFAYGIHRLQDAVWDADTAIRSRGGHRPSLRTLRSLDTLINTLSLWTWYLLREIEEMRITVQYVILSRIKIPTRKTPIARKWSLTDISILGIVVMGIVIPRVVTFAKVFLKVI